MVQFCLPSLSLWTEPLFLREGKICMQLYLAVANKNHTITQKIKHNYKLLQLPVFIPMTNGKNFVAYFCLFSYEVLQILFHNGLLSRQRRSCSDHSSILPLRQRILRILIKNGQCHTLLLNEIMVLAKTGKWQSACVSIVWLSWVALKHFRWGIS